MTQYIHVGLLLVVLLMGLTSFTHSARRRGEGDKPGTIPKLNQREGPNFINRCLFVEDPDRKAIRENMTGPGRTAAEIDLHRTRMASLLTCDEKTIKHNAAMRKKMNAMAREKMKDAKPTVDSGFGVTPDGVSAAGGTRRR